MAQLAQIEPHARAAVGVSALFKALNDQDSQLGVFFPTLTRGDDKGILRT
jgi:hypothetical protein